MAAQPHVPVLLQEVLSLLVTPGAGGRWLDCTLGAGGHSAAILEAAGPEATLVGLDRDPGALEIAASRLALFGNRAELLHANFADLGRVAAGRGPFRGILMDLGVSSMQLDRAGRGFSFRADAPLDMRMDPGASPSAAEWLAATPADAMADAFRAYGEEPAARAIARAIDKERAAGRVPATTGELAALVERVKGPRRGKLHPATRVFQAIRIAVNGELDALREALPAALDALEPGGRLAVISFHSLEDRIVKQFMSAHEGREESLMGGGTRWAGIPPRGRRVTRHPVVPAPDEAEANPRARSAKLRVFERANEKP